MSVDALSEHTSGRPPHFLEVSDLTVDDLAVVLDLAARPVEQLDRVLTGRGVALIFEKSSNRTRHSMEMAVVQLGGHPVYTRGDEVGFDQRESVEDITRILAGYHAVLAARVMCHDTLRRMAAVSAVPVVNLLSDRSHPMQALADVLTMCQVFGPLAGRRVAYVGDYNNVARSLAEASVMLGADVALAAPDGYGATPAELDRLVGLGPGRVVHHREAVAAVSGAQAVHTDVWTSMGQEAESEARRQAFRGWQVTDELMALADPEAVFLHCLPARRGEEVTDGVIDGPRSAVWQQAENRMNTARGALLWMLGQRP